MSKYTNIIVIIALLLAVVSFTFAYEAPKAQFKIYYPKGFDVYIPAEAGTSLFAFHGKLHEKMDGLEAGTWAKDIVTPENGSFVFRERDTYLKFGDTIHYWTYVVYNGMGYREENGAHTVSVYTPQYGRPSPPIRLRLPMIPMSMEARTIRRTIAPKVEDRTINSNRNTATSKVEDTLSSNNMTTVLTLEDNTSSSSTATTIVSLILFNIICLFLNF